MDNQQLQKWALIAEIVGGIAIVITLIFLVVETRSNTSAIYSQSYQALTIELNDNRRYISSQEMAGIYEKYRTDGPDSLTSEDRFRLLNTRHATWGIYESAYYSWQLGVLGDNEWARFSDAICRNRENDESLWGEEGMRSTIANNITSTFRDYVDSTCQTN